MGGRENVGIKKKKRKKYALHKYLDPSWIQIPGTVCEELGGMVMLEEVCPWEQA